MKTRNTAAAAALALILIPPALAADPLAGVTLRIPNDPDTLIVPVAVQGKVYPFALDTGSSHTIFDVSLRPHLGKPAAVAEIKTANGIARADVFQPTSIAIRRIPIDTGKPIATLDLREIRESSGHDVRGILGMDVLAGCVLRLDWGKGELAFLRTADAEAGTPLELTMDDGRPHIQASVAGRDHDFLVDTGALGNAGALSGELYSELVHSNFIANSTATWAVSASGRGDTHVGRLKQIWLGPFQHRNLFFAETGRNLIGISLLSRYVATFDFPAHRLYLKEGRAFHRPEYVDRSGLTLIWRDQRMLIESVRSGSAADRKGVRPLDELFAIENEPTKDMRLYGIRHFLSEPGRTVRLTLKREGRAFGVELRL